MTREQADIIIFYIEALEDRVNHQSVMKAMHEDGFTDEEVDGALKSLGAIAGRDCGIL